MTTFYVSLALIALGCIFALKSTFTAYDFVDTPITNIPELRRLALSFAATVSGVVLSLTFFILTNRL